MSSIGGRNVVEVHRKKEALLHLLLHTEAMHPSKKLENT
jgi:hypothetical protein